MTLLRAHRCRTLAPSSLCRASAALALSLAALPAAAQSQAWIQQFGTSGFDEGVGTAPDGSGGVYVAGLTTASLGGPSAGNYDAWLARHDGAGEQLWIRQFGTSA